MFNTKSDEQVSIQFADLTADSGDQVTSRGTSKRIIANMIGNLNDWKCTEDTFLVQILKTLFYLFKKSRYHHFWLLSTVF